MTEVRTVACEPRSAMEVAVMRADADAMRAARTAARRAREDAAWRLTVPVCPPPRVAFVDAGAAIQRRLRTARGRRRVVAAGVGRYGRRVLAGTAGASIASAPPAAAAQEDPDGPRLESAAASSRRADDADAQSTQTATADWQDTLWPVTGVYGFNSAQLCSDSDTFGSNDEILADLGALGASVVRQPGGCDLFAGSYFGKAGSGRDTVVVLPIAADIPSHLDGYRGRLGDFLKECYEAGRQVVLTLVSLGGGLSKGLEEHDGIWNAITGFDWEAHRNETLGGERGKDTSARDYLDIRDPYVVEWLAELAKAIAAMLSDVEADLQATWPALELSDVIYGLEPFNEVVLCNIEYSIPESGSDAKLFDEDAARRSAKDWAMVCHRMGRQIYAHFGGRIAVLLPGIASHEVESGAVDETVPARIHTWAWTKAWFAAFVERFQELHEYYTGSTTVTASTMSPSVDLHWYHRNDASEAGDIGPLHIVRLGWEASQLRDMLVDAGMWGTGVTVFENGTTVVPSRVEGDKTVVTHRADGWSYEDFQAFEVWRRVAGAAAAGAMVCGWHSYQSERASTNPFRGMGMREDVDTSKVEEMLPRPSWYAYRRLTSVFGSWIGSSIVYPKTDTVNADSARKKDGVVIEFVLPSGDEGTWAFGYVCFVDPWRGTGHVHLTATPTSSATVRVTEVEAVPSYRAVTIVSGSLPGAYAGYPSPTDFSIDGGGETFKFKASEFPRLFFCDTQLTWAHA